MSAARLFYALFVAAIVALIFGIPLAMRTDIPKSAGIIERFVAPGPLSTAHRSLAGSCSSCHTPVQGVQAKACLTCHVGTDFGDKQSTAFHAVAKKCTACHVEHLRDQAIVKMDHSALLDASFWASSKSAGKLPHRTEVSLNCASCHSIRDKHLGLFGNDCATCHTTQSWQIAGYRHPSTNSTQCVECHKAPPSHFMEHFSMVSQRAAGRKARVDQCFACHTTDSFNNIRRRGWYVHH